MEQKRFSPFEALVFGARAFIDNVRLFALTYVVVAGLTMLVFMILGLVNFGFFSAVGNSLYAHMQAGDFGPHAPAGIGTAIARELWTLASSYAVMLGTSFLVLLLFCAGITAGYAGMYLQVHDTGSSTPRQVLGFMGHTLTVFLALLLSFVAIGVGLLLCILPGLYIALRLSLVIFFIVDRNVGCINALRMSWQATQGQVWQLAGIALMQGVFYKLGVIGMFFTFIPALAYAYAYRKLAARL